MIYLSTIESIVISGASFFVLMIAAYILFRYYKKQTAHMKETKMMTLNDVIRYPQFTSFVKYQMRQQRKFYLLLFHIEGLDLLLKKQTNQVVSLYLRKMAKNVSMHLTYGSKLAQTPQRDTFMVYIPITDELDIDQLVHEIKWAASEAVLISSETIIQKVVNIGYTVYQEEITYDELIKQASTALLHAKRRLGNVTLYDQMHATSLDDYHHFIKTFKPVSLSVKLYDIMHVLKPVNQEMFIHAYIDNIEQMTFLKRVPQKDRAWVNMWMVEYVLGNMLTYRIKEAVSIPILISTLEKENFNERLYQLCEIYDIEISRLRLFLYDDEVTSEKAIVDALMEAKEKGCQIGYHIDEINQMIYHIIQAYYIDRLSLKASLIKKEDSTILDELLYFARANHLDIMALLDENMTEEERAQYHVTLIAQPSSKTTMIKQEKTKKKSGVR